MRRVVSAFHSGPGLPSGGIFLAGVACVGVLGWIVIGSDGRTRDDVATLLRSAPPAVAAQAAAPHGVHAALEATVGRQDALLSEFRARQAAQAADLMRLHAEIKALRSHLEAPPNLPLRKPAADAPFPDPDRLSALEAQAAALAASTKDLDRRLHETDAFVAQARALLAVASPAPKPFTP